MVKPEQYLNHKIILLGLLLVVLTGYDLTLGSIEITLSDVWEGVFKYDASQTNHLTLRIFRFPRVVMAILAGIGLALSGLLMQTLFQNPLAGPYVLGINSGASLTVALATMSGVVFLSGDIGVIGAALIGALGSGLFILFCSIYVRSKISLLLVGIMFGAFAGALVNVIQTYSSPEDLKKFLLWGFGSLQNVQLEQLLPIVICVLSGILFTLILVKPLNLLTLGDQNASFLGVRIKSVRILIVVITAIFTGTITAFCGPIAFVGLIVPNLAKMWLKTANHLYLVIGSALIGAILLLFCDMLMQLAQPFLIVPLNALTALMGAPIVVWIIIKRF
jgi:iron complex transport system permease protein